MLAELCFAVCSVAVNYPYDAVGETDTRPGTWGTAGYDDGRMVFKGVPEGYRVRVLRLQGNVTARLHGPRVPDNLYAGVLFGILTGNSRASELLPLAANGCLIYLQLDVNSSHSQHAEFDWKVDALLDADHAMLVRRAVYLNETGIPVHMEPSFVVRFRWERVTER